LRSIIPGRRVVEVHHSPELQRAFYKNLFTCGSVWLCTACSARVTERRAAELLQAVTIWTQERGFVAMVTYTLQHQQNDRLETLVSAVRDTHRRLKMGAPSQRFRERFGWHGSITALEVTYGANGWHPHLHELVFFNPVSAGTWKAFPDVAKERWLNALQASGRDASWQHGLNVRDAQTDVYDYLAKYGKLPKKTRWTLDRELAKSAVKKAHGDGATPWQLLTAYGDGDQRAGVLFQEYARVFKGRNQLTWSRGLRDELGLGNEDSDEAVAAELPPEVHLLAELNPVQWRKLLHLSRDIRGEVLQVAASGDRGALSRFLAGHRIYLEIEHE
jgi:hypothetical protein